VERNAADKNKNFFAGGFLYSPKENRILLHLRDSNATVNPDQWGFFGGTSENDELPKQCFLRELKEELNIEFREKDVKLLRDYLNEKRNIWRYVFYIESDLDKSAMRLGEGADFDWVPLDKILDYDLTDKTREDLEFFINRISRS